MRPARFPFFPGTHRGALQTALLVTIMTLGGTPGCHTLAAFEHRAQDGSITADTGGPDAAGIDASPDQLPPDTAVTEDARLEAAPRDAAPVDAPEDADASAACVEAQPLRATETCTRQNPLCENGQAPADDPDCDGLRGDTDPSAECHPLLGTEGFDHDPNSRWSPTEAYQWRCGALLPVTTGDPVFPSASITVELDVDAVVQLAFAVAKKPSTDYQISLVVNITGPESGAGCHLTRKGDDRFLNVSLGGALGMGASIAELSPGQTYLLQTWVANSRRWCGLFNAANQRLASVSVTEPTWSDHGQLKLSTLGSQLEVDYIQAFAHRP